MKTIEPSNHRMAAPDALGVRLEVTAKSAETLALEHIAIRAEATQMRVGRRAHPCAERLDNAAAYAVRSPADTSRHGAREGGSWRTNGS
jgi:hypothetical protein